MNEMSDKSYQLWIRIHLRIEYDEFCILLKHLTLERVDDVWFYFFASFICFIHLNSGIFIEYSKKFHFDFHT